MSDSFIMISEKGNIRRFRRGAEMFDPNAIDADGDGVVQEGTPFKRPAKPIANIQTSPSRQSRFWDYTAPKKPLEDLDLGDDDGDMPQKPKHTPWKEVNISPRGGPTPAEHLKPHEIVAEDVTLDDWNAFQDALTDHLVEIRDDDSVESRVRRGMVKLFGAVKNIKARKNSDGKLQLTMSDAERARIIKGIYSMNKRNIEMPNMKIISEMLKAVEKKSAFVRTNASVGRPFTGVRYKQASSFRHIVSPSVETHPIADFTSRQSGFRLKGEMPRQAVDVKALGRTLAGGGAGRRSGRLITENFDPNAVDADGDGLVQDSTPFERPVAPRKPQLLSPLDIDRSFGKKKPKAPNNVLKAQADRKAMNFNIERLRSTLRRVGSDYVPDWWDTSDNNEFSKKLAAASPEELSEIFARIYVERRSLMTAKVGRNTTGVIKVYADHRDDAAKKRGDMLKKRGEEIYKEMFGRVVNPEADPKTLKKQFAQFNNWWQLTADNSDWYFEQSFKITKRKRRRKLGITSPVNRSGTEWAEDPEFTEDAARRVLESIETDIRRANPRISDQSARRAAQRIIDGRDRRLSRTPNKTPRVGENRDLIPTGRRLNRRISVKTPMRENSLDYYSRIVGVAPNVQAIDHAEALKNMNAMVAQNEQKFGQMRTFQEFKAAFKTFGQDIQIDLFRSKYSQRDPSDYEKMLLHTYLHTFTENPEILNFPVTIKAIDSQSAISGVGGSHGMLTNITDPNQPAFRHVLHYQTEVDNKAFHAEQSKALNTPGGMLTVGAMDGVTNQVVKDYISKNMKPNMTQAEIDDVVNEASKLEVYMTALHESGHAVHSSLSIIDTFGKTPQPQLRQQLDAELDALSDADFKKSARGVMYDDIKNQMEQHLGVGQFFIQTSGVVDWKQYYKSLSSGKNANAPLNQQQKDLVQDVMDAYAANGINGVEALANWYHAVNFMSSSDKYDWSGMERLIAAWQGDSNVAKNGILDAIKLNASGKLDITHFRDKTIAWTTIRDKYFGDWTYNPHNRIVQMNMVRKTIKNSYDALTDAEIAIAAPALEKLSYYAHRTSRYGAAYGKDSNVEGIAELNAAAMSGILSQKNFTAQEIAVINQLVQWLNRSKS